MTAGVNVPAAWCQSPTILTRVRAPHNLQRSTGLPLGLKKNPATYWSNPCLAHKIGFKAPRLG
jgi:hypothetical protein